MVEQITTRISMEGQRLRPRALCLNAIEFKYREMIPINQSIVHKKKIDAIT